VLSIQSNGGANAEIPPWADDAQVDRAYASGRFFAFDDYRETIEADAEFVVVGSGPGGGIVSSQLALLGRDVIVVEAGPRLTKKDFGQDGLATSGRFFWDGAARSTRGNTYLPTLHARAVGGGSLLNSGICMRALPEMLDIWAETQGLDNVSADQLAPHYQAVEDFLYVRPQALETMGHRSHLLKKGCDALGYTAEPLPRIMSRCKGSGECFTGCRYGGKSSLDRTGMPTVLNHGGRLYSSVQIEKVLIKNGRAVGVEGHVVHPRTYAKGQTVRIHAKCVILASGPMATPIIAAKSGIKNPRIGMNLRMHPSVFTLGVFPHKVESWRGSTQGYHVTQFLNKGVKLEDVWASPGIFAVRFPAQGPEMRRYMALYPNIAVWGGWVSGEDSSGRVKPLPGGAVDYQYDVGPADVRRLQECTALLTEIYLAAGADEVLARVGGLPPVLKTKADVLRLRQAQFQVTDFTLTSNHVFGTMCIGGKPDNSATDPNCAVRGVTDLYVSDTSLLPLSPGANPMLSAMALAHRLAQQLARQY
jgi:choline dehydrogenase-like flavoprotein